MLRTIETDSVCIHPTGLDEYHYRIIMPSRNYPSRKVGESVAFDIYTQDIPAMITALRVLQVSAHAEDQERTKS